MSANSQDRTYRLVLLGPATNDNMPQIAETDIQIADMRRKCVRNDYIIHPDAIMGQRPAGVGKCCVNNRKVR